MTHTITLCQSCPGSLAPLADDLAGTLIPLPYRVTATECMSGCTRPAVVAFRAPGRAHRPAAQGCRGNFGTG